MYGVGYDFFLSNGHSSIYPRISFEVGLKQANKKPKNPLVRSFLPKSGSKFDIYVTKSFLSGSLDEFKILTFATCNVAAFLPCKPHGVVGNDGPGSCEPEISLETSDSLI